MMHITARIDKVAQALEDRGLGDLAAKLDIVANTLEDKEAGRLTRTLGALGIAFSSLFANPAKANDIMKDYTPQEVASFIMYKVNEKGVSPGEALKVLNIIKDQDGGKEFAGKVLELLRSPTHDGPGKAVSDTQRKMQKDQDGNLAYVFKTTVDKAGDGSMLKAEIEKQIRDTYGESAPEGLVKKLVEKAQSNVKPGSNTAVYSVPYAAKSA